MYSERNLRFEDEDTKEIKWKTELFQIQNELMQKKKLFSNLGSKLPDRGAKLKKDIEKLEIHLKDLQLQVQGRNSDNENSDGEADNEQCLKCEGKISEYTKNTMQPCAALDSICNEIKNIKISNSNTARKAGIVNSGKDTDHCVNNTESHSVLLRKGSSKTHPHSAKNETAASCSSNTPVLKKKIPDYNNVHKVKDSSSLCQDCNAEKTKSTGNGGSQFISEPNNWPRQGAKQKTFLNFCNITLKKKVDNGATSQVASSNTVLNSDAIPNKEFPGKTCNAAQEKLTFSDLRKEYEDTAAEAAILDDAKHGSWKGWRDSARQVKLTEAQPLPTSSKTSSPQKSNYLGTCTYVTKNQVKAEEIAKLHTLLKAYPSEQDEEDDPEGLKTKLMVHQKRALAWLMWREEQVPSGGIFADDMGLGKTLTMLSLILKHNDSKCKAQPIVPEGTIPSKATLIVCLTSVVHQWNAEVEKHCKSSVLNVLIYHGKGREKNLGNVADYDVVVTTYGVIASEGKSLILGSPSVPLLFQIHWERVILDEAHTIKNEKSVTAKCVYFLKASRRWAVTGTPIHNNVKDLYSLLKFLQYSPFDDYKIWKNFVGDHSRQSVERRNTLIKSILFRRSKEQCDETGKPLVFLPKKVLIKHELKLSETERKVYDALYDKSRARMINYLEARDQGSGNTCSTDSGNQSFLVVLLRLQQCCNHISLLKGAVEDDVSLNDSDISSIADSIASMSIGEDKNSEISPDCSFNLDEANDNFSVSFQSTKIEALFKELKKIEESDEKQKSVIVSQWVSMLEIVEHHLKKHSMMYTIIRGNTKPEDRTKASTEFNENRHGPKIMLLSLKAGGVGLNLIGGNHLFLLDHHWNPALESQACDRIYRVGQLRNVFIHKFLCSDTIEIKIERFQEEKSRLAKSTLEGGRNVANRHSFDDLKRLFGIDM